MKLTIRDKPPQITFRELRQASNFYLTELVPKRKTPNISLLIKFEVERGILGLCDEIVPLKKYKILVNPSISSKRILLCIAHEMVHLKQFLLNELEMVSDNRTYFKEKLYNEENMEYMSYPWEIEAFTKEDELYRKYITLIKGT